MKRAFSLGTAGLLLIASLAPSVHAQTSNADAASGIWTFFIKLDGAPPCQCVQIAHLRPDGTIDGPANDHFTGAGLGAWRRTGDRTISIVIAQNNINQDGSTGGVYLIRGSMTLDGPGEQASGITSVQILDSDAKPIFSGTASFKAMRLKVE